MIVAGRAGFRCSNIVRAGAAGPQARPGSAGRAGRVGRADLSGRAAE